MIWLIFSLLNALFESLKDVLSKKTLQATDEYLVAWSLRLFSLPFIILILYFNGIPTLGDEFFKALFITSFLNLIVSILFVKAIKYSDLSLTMPLIAFVPVFFLVTSPILLGEFPSQIGLIGILLIVFGSYILNINDKKEGYLAPFKALLKNRGERFMLIIALLWSVTGPFDKIAILNSSPIFFVFTFNLFITICLLPLIVYKSRKNLYQLKENFLILFFMGFSSAFSLIFQMTAVSMTLLVYAISVKRLSILFSSLSGHLFFNEKNFKERFLGMFIMLIGIIFIILFS